MSPRGSTDPKAIIGGRFHSIGDEYGQLVAFKENGSVSFECFHPERGRWWHAGRYDGRAGAIRLDGGESLPVEPVTPHMLRIAGRTHRRILDDGSVVGYPRTLDALFRKDDAHIQLRTDGTLMLTQGGDAGGTAERGRYDLYRGYAHVDAWGATRTIELLSSGDLRVGVERFAGDAAATSDAAAPQPVTP